MVSVVCFSNRNILIVIIFVLKNDSKRKIISDTFFYKNMNSDKLCRENYNKNTENY